MGYHGVRQYVRTATAVGPLDRIRLQADNHRVDKTVKIRLIHLESLLLACAIAVLAGCAGVSSGTPDGKQPSNDNPDAGQLSASPASINFGTVAVGSDSHVTGTLTAGTSDVTVASGAASGSGYSLSGITFPVTITAGHSVQYVVTFAPQAVGSTPGSVSFTSNASDSSLTQLFTGDGTQLSSHTVALVWDPSTSSVIGYNVYRSSAPGGPYSRINPTLDPGTSLTDDSVESGQTYYYVTTSVDSEGGESTYSNQAQAIIPNQ